MLVSLDITPSSMMVLADDLGPMFANLGHSLWRAVEILLSCLLVGAALVLPAYLLQRWWTKRRKSTTTATKPLLPAVVGPSAASMEPAKTLPDAPLPVAKTP
jgi:hypothetical protein